MTIDIRNRPNVVPWPPLIYFAVAAAAVTLGMLIPWRVLSADLAMLPGLGLIAGGVLLDFWAMAVMMLARTNILPHRPAGQLVTWGPFAWTRNPIYLGNTLGLVGIGVAFSGWFIVGALVAAVLVDRLAIRREEAHLSALFGDNWSAYARRVPRWLAIPRTSSSAGS
jgi:protein-S-isoprenylcysteine O-methyltransferase Ste14